MKSRVIGVSNGGRVLGRPVARLRAADPSFPELSFAESDFTIWVGYERSAATLLTEAGAEALRQARTIWRLTRCSIRVHTSRWFKRHKPSANRSSVRPGGCTACPK